MCLKVAVADLGRRLPVLTVGSRCGWRRGVAHGRWLVVVQMV